MCATYIFPFFLGLEAGAVDDAGEDDGGEGGGDDAGSELAEAGGRGGHCSPVVPPDAGGLFVFEVVARSYPGVLGRGDGAAG